MSLLRGLSRRGGPDTCWHVMNRGAQRMRLFDGPDDLDSMVRLMRTYTSKNDLDVYAYCVMPNHYHLLVRGAGERLSKCFHEVDRLWARSYNSRREAKGHVFQGTFLSFRQRSAAWMVRTSMYIHQNPVGTRYRKPGDYRWSSFGAYTGGNDDDWVETRPVLKFLDSDPSKARAEYRRRLNARIADRREMKEASEEKRFSRALARELARSMPALVGQLQLDKEEARRHAALYGRSSLALPASVLAEELAFPSVQNLSTHVYRLNERASKNTSVRSLVSRAAEVLDRDI